MPIVQEVAPRAAVRRDLRRPGRRAEGGAVRRFFAALAGRWMGAARGAAGRILGPVRRSAPVERLRAWGVRAAPRIRLVAVLGALLALAGHFLLGDEGIVAERRLRAEIERREAEVALLEEQIALLRADVERLGADPEESERAIREMLGLVRERETVYRFVESGPAR